MAVIIDGAGRMEFYRSRSRINDIIEEENDERLAKLHSLLDDGIEIRGHNGQIVLGKEGDEYIIPEHIMKKIRQGEPDDVDDYLDRLGI
jgi:hypothetical protein